MKSRTSSFNLTVFKKDITRFAPAWAIYMIVLLLVLVAAVSDGETYYRVNNLEGFVVVMAWINLFYGALVAQLVFGDLYSSRLCNALHAMPVSRSCWFVTHTVSGIAFSMIPNLALAIVAVPVMNLGARSEAIGLWLLAANLQYLFFFGTAVLCVMLSGNRVGQLALYALVQFGALLVYGLASLIYQPLLHGIQFNGEYFYPCCPVAQISNYGEIFLIDHERILNEMGEFSHYEVMGVAAGEGWGYMAIIAVVGVLALGTALVLYRKRKLECAGDFVAFSKTEPVVLILVTVAAGGFFHAFGELVGMDIQYVMLVTGLIVGFFCCKMLLERTTRVFRKKTILGCCAVLLTLAVTMGLTYLDPLGLTRYQPKLEDVESVTVSDSYSSNRHSEACFQVTNPTDIETVMAVHAACIDKTATDGAGLHSDSAATHSIHIEYTLKNGRSVHRIYCMNLMTEAGQTLRPYFSSPECVLGFSEEDLSTMAGYIVSFYTDGKARNAYDLEGLDMGGLLEALVADCKAGNMAQLNGYHFPDDYDLYDLDFDPFITSVEIGWDTEALLGKNPDSDYGVLSYQYCRIFRSCTNTLAWLEENGLLNEEMLQDLAAKYGLYGDEYITFTTGN